MDDIKNRRKFLKRAVVSNVDINALFIGASVNVLGRHLTVVAFADDFTRNALGKSQESTFAMIKPNAFQNAGHIISALELDGFHIAQLRTTTLSRQQANAFYAEHAGKPFFESLTSFMSSGPIVALQLIADNAITKWRSLIGPTNSETARAQAPNSIRARFGKDGTQNAVHGSDSTASAQREISFFFGPDSTIQTPFPYDNVSVCVIKPHVLHEKKAGAVLHDLFSASSFVVAAIKSIHLSKTNAGEFLQVYDGVIPSFSRHVDELASGPCLAVAVAGDSSIVASTVPAFPAQF
jgi:nucleoside-diphosphate kinase